MPHLMIHYDAPVGSKRSLIWFAIAILLIIILFSVMFVATSADVDSEDVDWVGDPPNSMSEPSDDDRYIDSVGPRPRDEDGDRTPKPESKTPPGAPPT